MSNPIREPKSGDLRPATSDQKTAVCRFCVLLVAGCWLLSVGLAATGCVTPYQATGFQGDFSEARIAGTTNEFWIEFRGNVGLDAKVLEQSLLRHAAEVTVKHGFTHFVVVGRSRQAGVSFILRPPVVGPSRHTERSLHITCYVGNPGVAGAIDARQR